MWLYARIESGCVLFVFVMFLLNAVVSLLCPMVCAVTWWSSGMWAWNGSSMICFDFGCMM